MSSGELDGAARVLRLLARKLEEWLEGDDLALETLAEALEQEGATPDDVHAAIAGLRGLAGFTVPSGWVAGAPGRTSPRVLSDDERDSLTPETWGYLLDLRTRGSLDADQLERVLEVLTSLEERPVEVERAQDIASRVALEGSEGGDPGHGDQEVAH